MNLSAASVSPRVRYAVAAAVGVLVIAVWHAMTPPAVFVPRHIGPLHRLDRGYYFDLASQVRRGVADDPRLGRTVAAAYGDAASPTLGVLAGVIKIGHGEEIASSLASGLAGGGVVLAPLSAAAAGPHGGTFECGSAGFGSERGTYCVWWNSTVVGLSVVTGPDEAVARGLALRARNATQR